MIEIANNTLSSSVTLTTSGSESDMSMVEELKKKIEETIEEEIEMVIATIPPTLPPTVRPTTTIPSPTTLPPTPSPTTPPPTIPPTTLIPTQSPHITYRCDEEGYSIYLSHYSLKCNHDCQYYIQ